MQDACTQRRHYAITDNITPNNYEPRRTARLAEETGEGGSVVGGAAVPVAPPTNPFLIEAVSIAEWDGTDVETDDVEM
ncbi:Hypp6197 [Branchiostoma lanceolatum]|uniref:Hypp6197 protein n=1 Tax=Branchiostoma lanceolatum TaxID=7740 RepID=A0A8J9YSS1_BRALA|nr:Hypp6197 [Branchiostoma lanceolatum]